MFSLLAQETNKKRSEIPLPQHNPNSSACYFYLNGKQYLIIPKVTFWVAIIRPDRGKCLFLCSINQVPSFLDVRQPGALWPSETDIYQILPRALSPPLLPCTAVETLDILSFHPHNLVFL